MQGRVDLKFRIHGDKQAGTLYFTSIRPKQEGAWRIGELILPSGHCGADGSPIQGYHRFERDDSVGGQGIDDTRIEYQIRGDLTTCKSLLR